MQREATRHETRTGSVYSVVFSSKPDGTKFEVLNIAGEAKPLGVIAKELRGAADKLEGSGDLVYID